MFFQSDSGIRIMKFLLSTITLIFLVAFHAFAIQTPASATVKTSAPAVRLFGKWRVKFTLPGGIEKNLIFESKQNGVGTFRFLDTGANNEPVVEPQPAVWSELTNERVSFASEAELPYSTCCREMGTLTFKG